MRYKLHRVERHYVPLHFADSGSVRFGEEYRYSRNALDRRWSQLLCESDRDITPTLVGLVMRKIVESFVRMTLPCTIELIFQYRS